MMEWRTIVSSNSSAHLVRGTEIEIAFPEGFYKRFAIYSVRTARYERDANHPEGGYMIYDVRYRIRDGETVSDDQIRECVRPAIMAEFDTLEECEHFLEAYRLTA